MYKFLPGILKPSDGGCGVMRVAYDSVPDGLRTGYWNICDEPGPFVSCDWAAFDSWLTFADPLAAPSEAASGTGGILLNCHTIIAIIVKTVEIATVGTVTAMLSTVGAGGDAVVKLVDPAVDWAETATDIKLAWRKLLYLQLVTVSLNIYFIRCILPSCVCCKNQDFPTNVGRKLNMI